jgi:sugar phosphate isomerase/epimerase
MATRAEVLKRLGIESLTTFWLPPVELVHLAADLGCSFIAVGLSPLPVNPEGLPPWSLREAEPRRAMKQALAERGITIGLGQGFGIIPGRDVRDLEQDLDLMCELGITRIGGVSMETEAARTFDQVGALADMAARRGVQVMMEFVPTRSIPDLPSALRIISELKADNLRLMIDCMHLIRSGSSPADLAALDPALIGYAQLCDAPLVPVIPDYLTEAVTERLAPGAGELPIAAIFAAMPADIPIGIEIPMAARAAAGQGARERTRECVESALAILADQALASSG